jgi:alkanesulfonate monooxygenase SsuD/methylene tetrahydromethanopterin reductase-like flavin-dependent oxidoreductase (luciferase family)
VEATRDDPAGCQLAELRAHRPRRTSAAGRASRAAIRRAARIGDAWHPVNPDLDWLRTTGLPALRTAAAEHERQPPALCPRIRARLTTRDLPTTGRRVGAGSLAQILSDIAALTELGATYVVLDTNPDDPADRRSAIRDQATLHTIATHVDAADVP